MTARAPALWLLLLAISCAGGSGQRPAGSAAEGDGDYDGEGSGAGEGAGMMRDGEDPAPQRMSCDDGTCSPCGDSFCLSGWYCDETAQGGPACGWLTECAEKPSCSCVTSVFSGCSCEEKGGGVHLSCG
jgi:hypothetical protein